jgi:hypothetical protein
VLGGAKAGNLTGGQGVVKPARGAQFLTIEAIQRTLPGMVRGGVLAAIAALAALPGCSLLLDFSEPVSDAAPVEVDASGACDDDEPNDTLDDGTTLEGELASALCPVSDLDYYRFVVEADGSDVVITLRFDDELDLRLTLLDGAGNELTVADGAAGEARIERTAAQLNTLSAGEYGVLVASEDAAGNEAAYVVAIDIAVP